LWRRVHGLPTVSAFAILARAFAKAHFSAPIVIKFVALEVHFIPNVKTPDAIGSRRVWDGIERPIFEHLVKFLDCSILVCIMRGLKGRDRSGRNTEGTTNCRRDSSINKTLTVLNLPLGASMKIKKGSAVSPVVRSDTFSVVPVVITCVSGDGGQGG